MPIFEFRWQAFNDVSTPIRPNGTNNSYGCFDALKGRYGVYVFHGREDGIVRYVGSAGTKGNPERDVYTRLKQQYTKSTTGATFYKRWHAIEYPRALRNPDHLFVPHNAFLGLCGQWSLGTLTISDHGAVELVPAVEHALIHLLRPKYVGYAADPGSMPSRLSAAVRVDADCTVLEVCGHRES